MPFATPPLGQLRFQPPVPQTSFPTSTATFNATSFGNTCCSIDPRTPNDPAVCEDCLTVNVFRPAGISASAKLPVMFWTYGGAFYRGAASQYDPTTLITRSVSRGTPIIFVSINYRVGPFGFPLGNEAAASGGLNLGVKDQIAGLNWVQTNIDAFGGDPEKVTAFGQSSGAIMTSLLFFNPEGSQLARALILASGSPATFPATTAGQKQPIWENLVAGVPSCASIATSGTTLPCMKNASVTDILASFTEIGTTAWGPVTDGPGGVLPDIPSNLYAAGKLSAIPFISGDVLDEGTDFVPQVVGFNYSAEFITEQLVASYSPPIVSAADLSSRIDTLLELYPDVPALGSPYGTGNETFGLDSGWKRLTSMAGDLQFQSTRRMLMQTAASAGSQVYGYLVTQPSALEAPVFGTDHRYMLNYIYGELLNDGVASDSTLSYMMMDYWLSYTDCLDPNDGKGSQRPTWARYTTLEEEIIQLNGDNVTMIPDNFRKAGIDAIDAQPSAFFH
ncbi:extracellular triacylglycerol lipase precursor [Mycena galopus ATCC 62051]|nr:extracellular triacylglycerol lipase precursor [Mycena galopus ATCC 62051]